jgi:polyisoprenyl-teichoic acid--peptidoglycan teichoic acid transferase
MFPDKIKILFKNITRKMSTGCKKPIQKGLLILLFVVLVIALGSSVYVVRLLNQTSYVKVPIVDDLSIPDGMLDDVSDPENYEDPDEYHDISQSVSNPGTGAPRTAVLWGEGRIRVYVDSRFPIQRVKRKDPNVENFLIFGLDALSSYDTRARADSIIIASVDTKNKTIKLTSIMRDTQVSISGRTAPNKINAAYVYGGIGLLINTINQSFDLDIQKFAMVDFWSSEQVIDAIGGVYLDITKEELPYINGGVAGANYIFKNISEPSPYVKSAGNVLLNGRQAVAYGRIRKIGNDSARTQRQRNVLTQAIIQFKEAPPSRKMAVFEEGSKSFETNVLRSEMIFLAFDLLQSMRNIQQYRVPEYGMFTSNTINYQLSINYSLQLPALHRFIWGNEMKHTIALPEELPEPTPTPEPTSTPQPTPTKTPTPEPISTPQPTPEPTLSFGPTITGILTPTLVTTPSGEPTSAPTIAPTGIPTSTPTPPVQSTPVPTVDTTPEPTQATVTPTGEMPSNP